MKWAEKLENSWTADERPQERQQGKNKVYSLGKRRDKGIELFRPASLET